jgi:hypothetical protein
MKLKLQSKSMPNLFSIGLTLCLALAGITPAQAGVKSANITQILDQDGRLEPYGPYRSLADRNRATTGCKTCRSSN